jgi:hypothetical protein
LKAEWLVGDGKGLDCREGALWYGGGQTVRLGKGFWGVDGRGRWMRGERWVLKKVAEY